jgi:lipopolysaccharide biosynthesis glycosyltransferase
MLQLYIGYDPREAVAFDTLAHSIQRRASIPVSIKPLVQKELRDAGLYTRQRGPTESTEFSLTRFLVPSLSGYQGWSLFMDCDMLCRADIADLVAAGKPDKAVFVVKHDYVPRTQRKFLDQVQTKYERKNWSSLMLFNNERCRALTADYVNSASGLELHRFKWIDDGLIGELPKEWNWLVTEYAYNPAAKLVHYTLGGPYFDAYRECDYAQEWFAEMEAMRRGGRR